MKISNYFISGEIGGSDLVHWLAEEIGLYGSNEAARIVLHINSPGGDVLTAIQVINMMKSSPVPVYTVVNGSAESAALLILMAGHRRAAFQNSFGMAHHVSTEMGGNYHSLKEAVNQLDILHNLMLDLWKEHSKLEENMIKAFMLGRGETYLTSQQMLTHGMIDEIIHPGPGLLSFVQGQQGHEKKGSKGKKQA